MTPNASAGAICSGSTDTSAVATAGIGEGYAQAVMRNCGVRAVSVLDEAALRAVRERAQLVQSDMFICAILATMSPPATFAAGPLALGSSPSFVLSEPSTCGCSMAAAST